MFVHIVYFYPADEAPADAGERLAAACLALLKDVPGVRWIHAGTPAGTDRPVVDNSYAAGLTVILEDSAAHDVYQTHPLHLQFIAENKHLWSRVQIYDFIAAR